MDTAASQRKQALMQRVCRFLNHSQIRLLSLHEMESSKRSIKLSRFLSRLRNAAKIRRTCTECGQQYPVSWFYSFLNTENRNERPTFYRGKWYSPQHPVCRICRCAKKGASSLSYSVMRIGEARNDRESKRHQQAA